MGPTTRPDTLATRWGPPGPPCAAFRLSSPRRLRLDLKPTIKIPPDAFPKEAEAERKTPKQRSEAAKIGGGTAAGAAGSIAILSNNITAVSMMRREQSTSRLWACRSNLIYLSLNLYTQLFNGHVIFSPHDHGHTFVIAPLVDLLVLSSLLFEI